MPSIESYKARTPSKATKNHRAAKGAAKLPAMKATSASFDESTGPSAAKRRPAKEARVQESRAKLTATLKGRTGVKKFKDLHINVVHVEGASAMKATGNTVSKIMAKPKKAKVSESKMMDNDDIEIVTPEAGDISESKNSFGNSEDKESHNQGYQFSFPGNDVLRTRFPKSVALAEAVVDDWINDGNFDELPLKHPLTSALTQKALKKAKSMEQKALTHPALEKAALQALSLGFRVQMKIGEIKGRFSKKKED